MVFRFNIGILLVVCLQWVTIVNGNVIKDSATIKQANLDTIITSVGPTKKHTWLVTSSDGFRIINHTNSTSLVVTNKTIKITNKGHHFFVNGKRIHTEQFSLEPFTGSYTFEGKEYTGSWFLKYKKDAIIIGTSNTLIKNETAKEAAFSKNTIHALKDQFVVRVLLEETDVPCTFELFSDQGFVLANPRDEHMKIKISEPSIVIKIKKNRDILLNDQKIFNGQAFIIPRNHTVIVHGKEYKGCLWVVADQSTAKLVNCIGIEEYVASVLCTESWPGWPLEVNKVFAIASRTYVIAMVKDAVLKKRTYHIKNTNAHQTYQGGNASQVIKQAVLETKGLFLTYNNQPITAMFDACCGGVIPAKMQGVNFKGSPYLARNYACTYCKKCKVYSWQVSFALDYLETKIQGELPSLRRLREVKIIKKDSAGLAQKIAFHGSNGACYLTGKKTYSLLNKCGVKSFCFSITKSSNTILFKGRGYGHHLGLCQWGARQMVLEGYAYSDVLDFYYPGTKLMRLL